MDPVTAVVIALVAIVVLTSVAPKIGVAGPLLLVAVGIGVSLLPAVPDLTPEPEVVLGLVLPPLLYSAAITTPTMDFRRDLRIISGLSVVLVVASALVVGALLAWLVPGVGLALGIAVGAVVSPTDAVATSIVRKAGLSSRVLTVLDGEAMLNDASALVLLRTAVAATAVTVSAGGVLRDFAVAVVVAVIVGLVVGKANLWLRARLTNPAASVAISLLAPFVAAIPAEHLHGSGLVAAVTAGLVTGRGSPRRLSPQERITESAVWRTGGLLLEGGVFLLMGLQASALLHAVEAEHASTLLALGLGVLVATVVVGVRAAFVAPSLWWLERRRRRLDEGGRLEQMQRKLDEAPLAEGRGPRPAIAMRRRERLQAVLDRRRTDLDYLASQRLGPREGVVLVWAGMRGAVTLAAAQTLPAQTPARAVLVLTAFVVAVGTLLVQGSTLPALVRRLGLADVPDDEEQRRALRAELLGASAARLADPGLRRPDGTAFDQRVLDRVRAEVEPLARRLLEPHGPDWNLRGQGRDLRLVLLDAERAELLRQRDLGAYPSTLLDEALAQLDAEQLSLDLR